MESFYRRLDEGRYESLPTTAGPWSPHAQHAGPPSALVARTMEAHEPRELMRLADLRLDILGPIPVAPLDVEVRTVRQGRSMELLDATLSASGTPVVLARGWRIVRTPDDFPRLRGHRPDEIDPVPDQEGHVLGLLMPGAHEDGYLGCVEWRALEGGPGTGGTAVAWGRQRVPLVAGEEPSPWQRALVLADSGGGITMTVDPRRHTYVNCNLHVVLDRDPEGEWIRMSSQALASPGHGGTVHTALADVHGDLGTGLQTMLAQDVRS
ncbi:thioesterase family protein [Janibacter cremeus]|uniref:thioesterase family protein n=1 Tax=Janibacter cremeus TaxID=1285192 RepID=UPI0023F711B6|nr:thioesterase family protein [Janibacter cremeus]WEV79597.1 thioesterase family protein [Janibacter cremeus]